MTDLSLIRFDIIISYKNNRSPTHILLSNSIIADTKNAQI